MPLTNNEKAIIRLIIKNRPEPAYMEALAADDEYARNEIAAFVETSTARLLYNISYLQSEIEKNQAELNTINGE